MASILKVDKLDPQSGTALEIGTSGDTITVPSGAGLTLTDSTLLLPTTITSTTEVKTNKISPATGTAFALGDSGDTFTVPSGATIVNSGTATGFGGGGVLQFKTAAKTDTYTSSITGPTDWKSPGLTVDITPTLSTSKILVMAFYIVGGTQDYEMAQRMVRTISGGSAVYLNLADASGSMGRASTMERMSGGGRDSSVVPFIYLDAPATTTATTYHLEIVAESSGTDVYLNRTQGETDVAGDFRGGSTISVMEIATGVL